MASSFFRVFSGMSGNNDQSMFTERTDEGDASFDPGVHSNALAVSPSHSLPSPTTVTTNAVVGDLMRRSTDSLIQIANSPTKGSRIAVEKELSILVQGAYALGKSDGKVEQAVHESSATRADAKEERKDTKEQIKALQTLMLSQISELSKEVGESNERTERVEAAYKEAISGLKKENEALASRVAALETKLGEQTGAASGLEGRIKGLEEGRDAVNQRMGTIEEMLKGTVLGQIMFLTSTFTRSAVDMTFTKADSRVLMIALAFAMVLHKNAARGMLSRYSIAPIAAIFVPIAIVMLFAKTVATIKNEKMGDVFNRVNKVRSERFTWIAVAALAISTALYSTGRQKNFIHLMQQAPKIAS